MNFIYPLFSKGYSNHKFKLLCPAQYSSSVVCRLCILPVAWAWHIARDADEFQDRCDFYLRPHIVILSFAYNYYQEEPSTHHHHHHKRGTESFQLLAAGKVKVVLAGCCASRIIHPEMYIYSRLRWRSKSLPQDLSLPPPFLPKIQNETSHQHRQTRAAFTLATLPIRRPCPRPFISCNFTVISLSLSLTGNILPATTTICCWNNHRFITGSIRIQFLACRWCLRASQRETSRRSLGN